MGGREETVTDEEILSLFAEADEPVLTTSDVADRVGLTNKGTGERLHSLEERGLLRIKEAGRAYVWWITEAGEEFFESDE